jgi:arylsulfatase A-like enzyme
MHRYIQPVAPLLLFVLAACGGGDPQPEGRSERPNILVLIVDDLTSAATGTWARGEALVETPGIDRLAARGVRFERALAPSPFCTPSRQAFLTGRWPHSIRVTQLFSRLDPKAPTLGTVFGQAGYATAAIGKMHWYRAKWDPGTDYGFDHIVDKPEWRAQLSAEELAAFGDYNAGWSRDARAGWSMSNPERTACPLPDGRQLGPFLVEQGLSWMDAQEGPFLCVLSLYEPHAPFPFPARLRDAVDPALLNLPLVDLERAVGEVPALAQVLASRDAAKGPLTEDLLRRIVSSYLCSVLWLDEQVAAIDAHLERSGRYDDTIVVLWSDNGYFLGEHGLFSKNYPFRETIEVPLAIAAPGVTPRSTPALVHSIDVFPTLCDLAGVPQPEFLEGHSRRSVLMGEDRGLDTAWSEFTGLAATLQDDRWKLVLGKHPGDGWDQLYDLNADPNELDNLFRDVAHAAVVAELTGAMGELLRATPADGIPAEDWMRGSDETEAIRWVLRQVENDRKPPPPKRR